MARVGLLAPADAADEIRPLVDAMDARGGFINVYRAMANSPSGFLRLYELLAFLWVGALSDRLREIVILSVVSASDAPYPLGWHLLDAQDAGLTADEIRSVVRGHDAGLSANDAAVARFARALTLDACVSDADYEAVAAFMDERQIVELTVVVGLYRLVACFATALEIEQDDPAASALAQFRREGG